MSDSCATIGVLGSGSWATALVKILTDTNDMVHWWVKDEYTKAYIERNKHNPNYLTSVAFNPAKLKIFTDINAFVEESNHLIFATPSIYLESALSKLTLPLSDKKIFSAIKGIVPSQQDIVGHYLRDVFQVKDENQGVILGPCHAEEVAMERLSYLTIGSFDEELGKQVADCLKSHYIRTHITNDVYGAEYGAVLKNIFALSAGVAHGLGYGDNFIAVLMSNAIREMENFLQKIYPMHRNINNSAYLGDLLVTGYSYFSRNRMLGNMIGKGYTVKSAILEMRMVAEGYYATKSIYEIAEKNAITMPITKAMYRILYEEKNPKKAFRKLSKKLN